MLPVVNQAEPRLIVGVRPFSEPMDVAIFIFLSSVVHLTVNLFVLNTRENSLGDFSKRRWVLILGSGETRVSGKWIRALKIKGIQCLRV